MKIIPTNALKKDEHLENSTFDRKNTLSGNKKI